MGFKYINPGYANLLDTDGGATVEGNAYSRTGVSLWQPERSKGVALGETPAELYGKFDAYLKSGSNLDSWAYIALGGFHGVSIHGYKNSWSVNGCLSGSICFFDKAFVVPGAVNTIWFHVKPGSSGESVLRVLVNGHEIGNKTNAGINFGNWKDIGVCSDSEDALLSNLIFSDAPINPKEQVVALPALSTETDMAEMDGGTYMATAAGQEILQSVDVSSLMEAYGEDSEVTGIALAGNPAYRTAEGLSSLTGISKSGDAVTEHGTHELKADASSGVVDSYAVSMKLSDLAGMQFGWKAGE